MELPKCHVHGCAGSLNTVSTMQLNTYAQQHSHRQLFTYTGTLLIQSFLVSSATQTKASSIPLHQPKRQLSYLEQKNSFSDNWCSWLIGKAGTCSNTKIEFLKHIYVLF